MTNPLLVMVPTYNEQENVEPLCRDVLSLGLALDLLFIDDSSTDGTGESLDRLADSHPCVRVIHRAAKLGIGSAHRAGITYAYENGYRLLVTMDCDFTHDPRHIPELIRGADAGAEVVVGSRYLDRTSLEEWNVWRKSLTRAGHWATRMLLGMPYDATSAYRCYRLDAVPRRLFELVSSQGYSFFFESLYVLHRNGFRIDEMSVTLPKRTYGHSKMNPAEIRRSLRLLFVTYFKSLFNPEKFEVGEVARIAVGPTVPRDDQGWDEYWQNQKTSAGGLLYDAVAAFYRRFIIRRLLNHFVDAHFAPGSQVLHAGCGGGQVDADIRHRVSIIGLDVSTNALDLYNRLNGKHCRLLHGSILDIPMPDGSVQGVYNLGVMEHFAETDIRRALAEFHRVLAPSGRVLIMWPPEFGSSVLFLKGLKLFLEKVLRKRDVRFHPDEITRVRSKRHVAALFEESGFRVVEYYFGPRDLFTYVVIAAERTTQPDEAARPMVTTAVPQ